MAFDSQYGFSSSQLTANLLTVVSVKIARTFNKSEATRTVPLDISKVFDLIWPAGLLRKLKSYGLSGQVFGLVFSFFSNRKLLVVLDRKSLQESPIIQLVFL